MVPESPRPAESPLFASTGQGLADRPPSRNTDSNTRLTPREKCARPPRTRAGRPEKPLTGMENPVRHAGFSSICRESWYIGKNKAHEARAVSQTPEDAPPPYFNISPDEALAELEPPVSHRRLRRHRPRLRPGPRGPDPPRPRGRRRPHAAPLLHLGDHPLPDPGGAAAFPPGAARQPRPPPGPERDRRRRQVVHPRRGAAPARAFRRRGQPRQGIPPLPPDRACRPRSPPSPTSRAASARPRRRRTSPCRPRSTATGCW